MGSKAQRVMERRRRARWIDRQTAGREGEGGGIERNTLKYKRKERRKGEENASIWPNKSSFKKNKGKQRKGIAIFIKTEKTITRKGGREREGAPNEMEEEKEEERKERERGGRVKGRRKRAKRRKGKREGKSTLDKLVDLPTPLTPTNTIE